MGDGLMWRYASNRPQGGLLQRQSKAQLLAGLTLAQALLCVMVTFNTYLYRQQDGAFPDTLWGVWAHDAQCWCECWERCCVLHANSNFFGPILSIQV